MIWSVRFLLVVLALLGATPLYAVQVDEILPDPGTGGSRPRDLAANCAAWCARTSRSTIPKRRWRAICACWCASGSRPATATRQVVDFMVARYGEFVC